MVEVVLLLYFPPLRAVAILIGQQDEESSGAGLVTIGMVGIRRSACKRHIVLRLSIIDVLRIHHEASIDCQACPFVVDEAVGLIGEGSFRRNERAIAVHQFSRSKEFPTVEAHIFATPHRCLFDRIKICIFTVIIMIVIE